MTEYAEKLASIGFAHKRGSSRKRVVIDERDGSNAGYHIDHWNDRTDAVATPKTTRMQVAVNQQED